MPLPVKNTPAKRWCLTVHHSNPQEIKQLLDNPLIERFVGQQEKTQAGIPHYQIYMELKTAKRWQQVKALFAPHEPHIEQSKGTPWQNYIYCTKEDSAVPNTIITKGEFKKPRSVTREESKGTLIEFIDNVKAGMLAKDLMEKYPDLYLRHQQKIPRIRMDAIDTQRTRAIGVMLLTGATGVGKSFSARQYARWHNISYYAITPSNPTQTCWFDGYEGQPLLIIEDFDGGIQFRRLLTLLDHYNSNLEVKGSFASPNWTDVIITSNTVPAMWYRNEEISPLLRRINVTVECVAGIRATDQWDWKTRIPLRECAQFVENPAMEVKQPAPVEPISNLNILGDDDVEFEDLPDSDLELLDDSIMSTARQTQILSQVLSSEDEWESDVDVEN